MKINVMIKRKKKKSNRNSMYDYYKNKRNKLTINLFK